MDVFRLAVLIAVMVLLVGSNALAYSGYYNKSNKLIMVNGTFSRAEYIFLHEWCHSFYNEVMSEADKAAFNNSEEYYANVCGQSYEIRLKPGADLRVIKAMGWD